MLNPFLQYNLLLILLVFNKVLFNILYHHKFQQLYLLFLNSKKKLKLKIKVILQLFLIFYIIIVFYHLLFIVAIL